MATLYLVQQTKLFHETWRAPVDGCRWAEMPHGNVARSLIVPMTVVVTSVMRTRFRLFFPGILLGAWDIIRLDYIRLG